MAQDFTTEDVDQMVNNIETTDDINGNQPERPEELTPDEAVEKPGESLSFKTVDDLLKHKLSYKTDNGKDVEEDLATILQRASGGYHFAQRMNEYKQLMAEYDTKHKPLIEQTTQLQEKYGKFEEYAKENPEWYDHWSNAYENRHNLGTQSGEIQNDEQTNIQAMLKDMLSQELGPVKEFMTSQQQAVSQQQVTEQDRELSDAVNKTREQFSNIDFDKTDPATGKSLEYETLEFMHKTGIADFNTAFKAFYHDNIVKMQVENARDSQVKADQELKKNGILGIKTTPSAKRTPNLQGKNLDQLMEMAQNDPEIFGR